MARGSDAHPDDLMTTGEAARVLGLSSNMVRWLEREGRLRAQGRPLVYVSSAAATLSSTRQIVPLTASEPVRAEPLGRHCLPATRRTHERRTADGERLLRAELMPRALRAADEGGGQAQ